MNQEKDIAFVISAPFFWFVYKNIYEPLKHRSIFIIDLGASFSDNQELVKKSIIDILEKNNAPFVVLYQQDYKMSYYLKSFFAPYKVLISGWDWGCMDIAETSTILKVNTTYGVGKELTLVRPGRCINDLILSYGERDTALFSLSTKTIAVGNPKFDDFYNKKFDKNLLEDVSVKINPSKKTVLFVPTHGDLSSFHDLIFKFEKLESYNVIVKLHYNLVFEEADFLIKHKLSHVIMLGDEADLITLLSVTDIAVSDNSSVIFDVIQANKPLLVADFWDSNFLDEDHKKIKFYKRGRIGASSYSGSIEQIVKREKIVATFEKGEDLEGALNKAFVEDFLFKDKRNKLKNKLFAYEDGKSGERAASCILKLINKEIKPEKGILFHSRINEQSFRKGVYIPYDVALSERAEYKKIIDSTFRKNKVKVIIIDSGDKSDDELSFSLQFFCKELNLNCIIVSDRNNTNLLRSKYSDTSFISSIKFREDFLNLESEINVSGYLFICSGAVTDHLQMSKYLNYISNNQDISLVLGKFIDNSFPRVPIYKEVLQKKEFRLSPPFSFCEVFVTNYASIKSFVALNNCYISQKVILDILRSTSYNNFEDIKYIIKQKINNTEKVSFVNFTIYLNQYSNSRIFNVARFAKEQSVEYFYNKQALKNLQLPVPCYSFYEILHLFFKKNKAKNDFGIMSRFQMFLMRLKFFLFFTLFLFEIESYVYRKITTNVIT